MAYEQNYVTYYRENTYGIDRYYLVPNQILEPAILGLTGRKTLTSSDIRNLSKLGLVVSEVLKPAR